MFSERLNDINSSPNNFIQKTSSLIHKHIINIKKENIHPKDLKKIIKLNSNFKSNYSIIGEKC